MTGPLNGIAVAVLLGVLVGGICATCSVAMHPPESPPVTDGPATYPAELREMVEVPTYG